MTEDFEFGNCMKCGKKAITAINAGETPLCPFHYIEQEDDECLRAYLRHRIDEIGKIDEPIEVQLEIKKQKPEIYNYFEGYFEV